MFRGLIHLISILTVKYHSEEVFPEFLASLDRIKPLLSDEIQLLVHDNTDRNIGLSKAVNRLLPRAKGDLVLFANPDVVFNESFTRMIQQVRNTGCPATPVYINYNVDRRYPTLLRILASYSWIGNLLRRHNLNPIYKDYLKVSSIVEQAGGSFLLMPKHIVDQLSENGQFYDERFPILWNDVDLSMRARTQSIRILKAQECRIEHVGSHSVKSLSQDRRYMLFYSSAGMIGFARKWKMHPHIIQLAFFVDAILRPKLLMRFRCTLQ